MRNRSFAVACLVLAGCTGLGGTLDPQGALIVHPPPSFANDGGDGGAATGWEIPIRVVQESLGPVRVYCLATQGDAGVALLVDTGSQVSFLSTAPGSPDYVPDAGVLWLGDRERVFAGRPYSSDERIDGRPVVGFLGNDFFFEAASELDLDAELIRRTEATWDAGGWTALSYENRHDFIFVNVRLDDADRRLAFDTGAAHTLLLDAGAQPGDQPVSTQDAYGNPLIFYLGSADLSYADAGVRTVPILRAPSFPSLEDSNRALGGPPIHGLFGLTSVGGTVIRIDAETTTIWLR